jgi:sn-glycerol 3-phosphate transport system permease protein
LNAVLNLFHLPSLRWLNSSKTALLSIIIVSIWKSTGYYLLIVLASLKSIPQEIFEAAELDNTPRLRKFFRITLPLLSPQLFFMLITITINSFKVFDTVRVMTDGGPGNSTDVVIYYLYRYAFRFFRVGIASAAGVILMAILVILTIIYFRFLGKRVHYQ